MRKLLPVLALLLLVAACQQSEAERQQEACRAWASSMVPSGFILGENDGTWIFPDWDDRTKSIRQINRFADGQEFSRLTGGIFKQGYLEGQNVNLFYPMVDYMWSLDYESPRIVDASGLILGKNSFSVTHLVLRREPLREERYRDGYGKAREIGYFSVVNFSIDRCGMVQPPARPLDPLVNWETYRERWPEQLIKVA